MFRIRLLAATSLTLLMMTGAQADGISDLADCKEAFRQHNYDVATFVCAKAADSAATPADLATAEALFSAAKARLESADRHFIGPAPDDPNIVVPAIEMQARTLG